MEIEVKIDNAYKEPKVVVYTAVMSSEVNAILDKLKPPASDTIVGFEGDVATILEPTSIIRLYAEKQKVYADTHTSTYAVRLRLYEAESLLDNKSFVRISNSEIINLRQVDSMDLSFTGTICIRMQNGVTAYVSRRYVQKIKAKLGL